MERRAHKCYHAKEYGTNLRGDIVLGCTEDNIWCNDNIAANCKMYVDNGEDWVEYLLATEVVDKIAGFLEQEDNWHKLKSCWLENDRSEDLRKLLTQALEAN